MPARITSTQNPLDKKWWKDFTEDLKKDIKKSPKKKAPSHQWISEINCTQEDIGEPHYLPKRKSKRN
ncbi:hypothetical protein [endosymbiont GvMRE of Glomus versiforme]|uniref:hypothetical protein n=1 Tax=endosymbiont GvMRE of Glomus versiforme TaxID=2039283 RepID=UPI000EC5ED63|nr:hypothetical protein [endosymbiont GvMRE of Glomus versiforme]RHZ36426.1 hypothetical protein GvMRE_Ic1g91 [endosymbiont GvMRE of Glomus versiforme]